MIYEGTPGEPTRERHLEIIERYGVSVYYTAPTLIRTFMSWFGQELPGWARSDLAAPAGHRGRGDQPRGLGVVPPHLRP